AGSRADTQGVLKIFWENVICDSVTYTEQAKRKTVTSLDVVYTLKQQGQTLYGFGASNNHHLSKLLINNSFAPHLLYYFFPRFPLVLPSPSCNLL
ncbi:hypothetical protein PSHT_07271, partial [Puccinia striiformis]